MADIFKRIGLPCLLRNSSVFAACRTSTAVRRASATSGKLVETETVGKVFLVGINRPEKRNCVNYATAQELIRAFDQFEKNDELWVAVLYGKGGSFCAGYDMQSLSQIEGVENKTILIPDFSKGEGFKGPTRRPFSKPLIAAVEGYAVAGGLEMALMCDLRVVDETAIMGVFCRRFGIPLIDGGTVRLPQLIGLSRALDLILTGRPVTADEALEFGIANRVVKSGTAVGEAVKLAQSLCKFPQDCMRKDRTSAYNSTFNASSFHEAINFERENARSVIEKESIGGAQRFVDGAGRGGNFDLLDKSKL